MTITIRQAVREELQWINARYSEINFKPSNFDRELIAIAEVKGQKAGLGRLVLIDEHTAELGGMFVLESYRGYGIAGKIVEFLLQHSEGFQRIFCIPFAHLKNFYGRYGFVPVTTDYSVPIEIAEKHRWCNQAYDRETLLLILDKSQP